MHRHLSRIKAHLALTIPLSLALIAATFALLMVTGHVHDLSALLIPAGFGPMVIGATGLDQENLPQANMLAFTGAPTAGELAGLVAAGTCGVDVTNGNVYQNVGTKAAPVWRLIAGKNVGLAQGAAAEAALVGTGTITAAQILARFINGTPVAAATYTTDTAVAIIALLAGAAVGDSFEFYVTNTSGGANTITLAGGTGVTLRGNLAVPQNKTATVKVLVASLTTLTGYVTVSA